MTALAMFKLMIMALGILTAVAWAGLVVLVLIGSGVRAWRRHKEEPYENKDAARPQKE